MTKLENVFAAKILSHIRKTRRPCEHLHHIFGHPLRALIPDQPIAKGADQPRERKHQPAARPCQPTLTPEFVADQHLDNMQDNQYDHAI